MLTLFATFGWSKTNVKLTLAAVDTELAISV